MACQGPQGACSLPAAFIPSQASLPSVAPSGCACGGSAPSGELLGGTSFTPTGEGSGGHCGCHGAKENGASPAPRVGAIPRRTTNDAPTPGSMFVPGSRVPRLGTPPVQFNVPRGPRVPMSDNNGWRGNVPVPTVTTSTHTLDGTKTATAFSLSTNSTIALGSSTSTK